MSDMWAYNWRREPMTYVYLYGYDCRTNSIFIEKHSNEYE